jgi:hypothetical protein
MTRDTIETDDIELRLRNVDVIEISNKVMYDNLTNIGLIAAQQWNPYQIIMDSNANASVFKNRDTIWNCRAADLPLVLNGVQKDSKPIVSNLIGDS